MDAKHAILLTVDAEGSEGLVGRTLLQKKVYFAAILTNQDYAFRPHYYGPYSRVVADATDALVSNRFLEEQVQVFADTNMFGEIRRHTYRLADDGRQVVESLASDEETKRWQAALEKINRHPFGMDFNMLSVAAKVSIISRTAGGAIGAESIRQRAKGFGWTLGQEQPQQVAEFLDSLGA